jgi:membrane-associated protease RseP (regulator of RpoE activity)
MTISQLMTIGLVSLALTLVSCDGIRTDPTPLPATPTPCIPQEVQVGRVRVTSVSPNSPAESAGIQVDDIIVAANGQKIYRAPDLVRIISLNAGTEMEWLVERGTQQQVIRVTPRLNPPPGEGATGIGIELIDLRMETWCLLVP